MIEAVLFYGFSSILVLFALGVILSRNVFRAALCLTGALTVVACLFALLGADFLAASQLLVYVGGVMVILLFVIVFFQRPPSETEWPLNKQSAIAAVVAVSLMGVLLSRFGSHFSGVVKTTNPQPTTASLGRLFLTDWIIPFEVVSLVLLVALIGAVFLSKKNQASGADDL